MRLTDETARLRKTRVLMTALASVFMLLLPDASDAGRAATGANMIPLAAYAQPGLRVPSPGGGHLNLRCSGTGSPTVVLTAGAGEQSLTWRALQARISTTTRSCAWDRPGFGFSDASRHALDADHLTDSLEAALRGAKLPPPYILVGHSIGSFETLMFAFRHPREVAGLVLIDPAGPFQDERLKRAAPETYRIVDSFQTAQLAQLESCIRKLEARTGPAADDCAAPPDPQFPQVLNDALHRLDDRVEARKAMFSLLNNMASGADSRQLMRAWRPLGAIPIIVLTAGQAPPIPVSGDAESQMPALQAEWSAMHDDMAALSTRGINRTVPGAGHYIYKDRPEAVIAAIGEAIGDWRRRSAQRPSRSRQ